VSVKGDSESVSTAQSGSGPSDGGTSNQPALPAQPTLSIGFAPGKDERYSIGPGDVLSIMVHGEEGLLQRVKVSPFGVITFPLVGDVKVDGMTENEVKEKITTLLAKDYLVDPKVTVTVVEFHSKTVYILGDIKQPGFYELTGEGKLLNTLLKAGGPNSFEAKLKILRITEEKVERGGQVEKIESLTPITVDIERLFVQADASQNILLQSGDVLILRGAKERGPLDNSYYVLGEVGKPGLYPHKSDYTVLNAILDAGGFTQFASRNSTKLVRETADGQETVRIRMGDVMAGGREKNPPLKPGDMIIVPKSLF